MDHVDFIMKWEGCQCSMAEVVAGFQRMIDDGTVWSLQGVYGRTARQLIDDGYCTEAR